MEVITANAILEQHNELMSWPQPFLLTSDGTVDLSVAIGINARTPNNVSHYQPYSYPTFDSGRITTCYRFDPSCYCGAKDQNLIMSHVKQSLPGVSFFTNNNTKGKRHKTIRLVCSFSKKLSKETLYQDECFMKIGTPLEPTKRLGSNPFGRMDHQKLKQKKEKPTVDNRSGKWQKHVDDESAPLLPRTYGHSATCNHAKCSVFVTLIMCVFTGYWYLSSNGHLDHILHVQKHAMYQRISEKHLDASETNLVNILYSNQVKASIIGRIMESLRSQKGRTGRLLPATVHHAAKRHQEAMDLISGISKHWSVAEKTIAQLEVQGISYYALMMDKHDNVFVQKCKGRPSVRERIQIEMHGELKSDMKQLRKDMSMNASTEILLSISIATSDMQRAVHMFPEVLYMDVVSKTNRQKRDVFLLVIKDASGETNIGNVTILPCGKKWMFTYVYQHFFSYLYGNRTVARVRLALTDDDIASHGAFNGSAQLVEHLHGAKHMLCVFHAVVMKFQDMVYDLLPKKRKSTELSDNGALYGEICGPLFVGFIHVLAHHFSTLLTTVFASSQVI